MDKNQIRFEQYRNNMLNDDRSENIGSYTFLERMKPLLNISVVDMHLLKGLLEAFGTSASAHGLLHYVVFEDENKENVETIFFLANTKVRANQPMPKGGNVGVPYELRHEGKGKGLVMYGNKYQMMRLSLLNKKADRLRNELDKKNAKLLGAHGADNDIANLKKQHAGKSY